MARTNWIRTVAVCVALVVIVYVYFTWQGKEGADVARSGERGGIRSPIELQLTLLAANEFEGDDSGGEVVVGIELKPLIDAPDMKWFLQVPEGLAQIAGESTWEGRMEKDEEKSLRLTLSVPDGKRYELYSRAEIYLDNGDVVTKGAGLRIDLGPEDPGEYPPFERVDDKGRKVITFKGESGEGGQE